MADRTEFLESIRHRTRRGRYKPTKSPDSVWTPGVDRPEREEIEDPPARFIEELEALGGHGKRTESLEEARDYVLDLARERRRSYSFAGTLSTSTSSALDEPLREAGVEVALWHDAARPQGDSRARGHRALDRYVGHRRDGQPGAGARSGAGTQRNAPAADLHSDTSSR